MEKNKGYEKLKKLRKANKLSYKMMAEKLNMSTSYYWQIENKQKNLYYHTAVKIAE